jgi:hypothetical protein
MAIGGGTSMPQATMANTALPSSVLSAVYFRPITNARAKKAQHHLKIIVPSMSHSTEKSAAGA